MLLLTVTTRAPGRSSSVGSSRPVSAKCPKWFVPSCSSKPSAVSAPGGGHHARIAHQQVDAVGVLFGDAARDVVHAREVGQVEAGQRDGPTRLGGQDLRDRRLPAALVPAGHDDVGAVGGELVSGSQSEAAVGAGDHRNPARLIRDVRSSPSATRHALDPAHRANPPHTRTPRVRRRRTPGSVQPGAGRGHSALRHDLRRAEPGGVGRSSSGMACESISAVTRRR